MINHIPNLHHAATGNFLLIAGPCVIEDRQSPSDIAKTILEISDKHQIPFVFKASY
jgi:2-dehydro-3-deoxyphosphooctonate aldolase (KDO 8-P synthase)